jgi:hypothetical protein
VDVAGLDKVARLKDEAEPPFLCRSLSVGRSRQPVSFKRCRAPDIAFRQVKVPHGQAILLATNDEWSADPGTTPPRSAADHPSLKINSQSEQY